jgi:hypothetical protein
MSAPSKSSDVNPMDENLPRIPKILYKYRSFDSCGYGVKLASHGEAYFASAKDFNDPFDNYFIPTTKVTNYEGEDLVAFLRRKAKEHYPGSNESKTNELVELGKKRHQRRKDGDPRVMEPVFQVQYNGFGIFSLTAEPRSLPMWAYYGDCHKGMCIGLRSAVIAKHQRKLLREKKLMMLHKVHYCKRPPEYCIDIGIGGTTDTQLHDLEATLYTKSECWKHEDEYRLIFRGYAARTYTFGTDAVAEVIIGSRTSPEDLAVLLEQLSMPKSKVTLKRAVRSQSQYALELEELQW